MDRLKSLLGKKPPKADTTELIYIYLPEALQPIERGDRYDDPLDADLQLRGLGCVSGGGTQMGDELPDGSRRIESCSVDVDATNVAAARVFLRQELPLLGCIRGTQLWYREHDVPLMDAFDGTTWLTDQARDDLHPGFEF